MAREISRFQMSILLRIALLFFPWCSLSFAQESLTTVFSHVNVIPMDREIVLRDQTVIVKDGKIVALGPTRSVTYVRPVDENTRALIEAMDTARKNQRVAPHSIN